MSVLVIEAHAGIAGDLFVAAAAALAGCEAEILELPQRLGLAGVRVAFDEVDRSSMRCRRFQVLCGEQPAEEAAGSHHQHHAHAHAHHHHHHDHAHDHRSLSHICGLIQKAGLDETVTRRAIALFERLGVVEAAAHGIPVDSVHFHEVGAVDSIIDIVAAALCIERLAVDRVYASPICVGSGSVRTAHGLLPVPAPATEALLRGLPCHPGDIPGEWTTPTGALILASLDPVFDWPELRCGASALGAGSADTPGRPNALRLRLAEEGTGGDTVSVVRCQIDDSPGELLGADLLETLLAAGACDAFLVPVVMKKGRPGQLLEVLVNPAHLDALTDLILCSTSTIGLRVSQERRRMLSRRAVSVNTPWGPVAAKQVDLPGGQQRISPEYEACAGLAREHDLPVVEVYRAACAASAVVQG